MKLLKMLLFLIALCLFAQAQGHNCDAKESAWYVMKSQPSVACSVTAVTTDRVYYLFLRDHPGSLPTWSSHSDFHTTWKRVEDKRALYSATSNATYNYGDLYVKRSDSRIHVVICGTKIASEELMVVYKRSYQWPDGPERQMLERNFAKQYKKIGVYSPD